MQEILKHKINIKIVFNAYKKMSHHEAYICFGFFLYKKCVSFYCFHPVHDNIRPNRLQIYTNTACKARIFTVAEINSDNKINKWKKETKLCLHTGNQKYTDLGYCSGQKWKVYCNRDQMS